VDALRFGTIISVSGGEGGGYFTPIFGTVFFDCGAEGFVLRFEKWKCTITQECVWFVMEEK